MKECDIGAEYFQSYGSPFLLTRCQGPEHPKISQFLCHSFGQAMLKWLLGDVKLNITRRPDPEILVFLHVWNVILPFVEAGLRLYSFPYPNALFKTFSMLQ